jgi:hypothetical protein
MLDRQNNELAIALARNPETKIELEEQQQSSSPYVNRYVPDDNLNDVDNNYWSLYLYAMKSPVTREKYVKRLEKFFDFNEVRGNITSYYKVPRKYSSLRVTHSSTSFRNRYRYTSEGSLQGGLYKAWVGFVIAQSQNDYEKMRKYVIAIQKFERLLNKEINEFPQLGLYYSDAFENKEEDEDSKLPVIDPWADDAIEYDDDINHNLRQ